MSVLHLRDAAGLGRDRHGGTAVCRNCLIDRQYICAELGKNGEYAGKQARHGPIYKREGFEGEAFTITESNAGEASGVFVTRESAGITHTERINNLALPPNNTAMAESTVQLTRSQILLEGKVAAQPDWAVIADDGIPRSGGGWQVVTDGGKYNGAIER